jgi:hypothetical protein
LYGTRHYHNALAYCRRRWKNAAIIGAAGLYDSDSDWLRRFPAYAAGIDGAVVLTRGNGTVGLGGFSEVSFFARRGGCALIIALRNGRACRRGAFEPSGHENYRNAAVLRARARKR